MLRTALNVIKAKTYREALCFRFYNMIVNLHEANFDENGGDGILAIANYRKDHAKF